MFILNGLFGAINFLTVFKIKLKNENLARAIKYFPLAGLFIGAVLAFAYYVFNVFLPEAPAVLLSIFFLFVITGGLHFDGLSDTSDGLFAYLKSGDKDRFYKAMKDVNTGAAGSIAVIFYVLIIWSLVLSANPAEELNFYFLVHLFHSPFYLHYVYLILLTFPVAGRYSIVVMSYFSETPENFKGTGTIFTEGTDIISFAAASFFALAAIYFFLRLAGIFSLLVTVFIVLCVAWYFKKTFGGVNGDMLGFTVKLSEVVFIATLIGFSRVLY